MNSAILPRKRITFVLFLILAVTMATRLLTLTRPLAGNFASRQIPYAMAAEKYLAGGNWLLPETYHIVNGKPTYMMLDFPVISLAAAGLSYSAHLPIDASGRLLSCLFMMASCFFLFLIVKRREGEIAALGAAAAFSFSPLGIIYGQSFQADSMALCALLMAVYFFIRSLDTQHSIDLILSAIALGGATLMRIQSPYILLPLAAAAINRQGWKCLLSPRYAGFLILSFLGPLLWYLFTYNAVMRYDNIIWSPFHQTSVHAFPHPLLFQPDFYILVAKYWVGLTLNPLGFLAMLAGLWIARKKSTSWSLWFSWLIAITIFIFLLPRKIHDHNYYLLAAVPIASIFAGICIQSLIKKLPPIYSILSYVTLMLLSLWISWKPLTFIPPLEQKAIHLSAHIKSMVPENAKVIYHPGSMPFMYYTKRVGWSYDLPRNKQPLWLIMNVGNHLAPEDIQRIKTDSLDSVAWLEYLKVREGATFFASLNPQEVGQDTALYQKLTSFYRVIEETSDLLLVELNTSKASDIE